MDKHPASPDIPESPEPGGRILGLRRALAASLEESQAEIARLHRQRPDPVPAGINPASAADDLALRQELQQLRQILEARERALQTLTDEYQQLEDSLEDRHLAFDRLKKELAEKEALFELAREDSRRLRQELDAAAGARRYVPPPSASVSARRRGAWWPCLGASLLLAAVLAVLLLRYPGLGIVPDAPVAWSEPEPPLDGTEPAADSAPAPAMPAPTVQRDRLRDGSHGPPMAALAGGSFEMGYLALAGEDFGPVRRVRIAPFWMGVHEVTFDDYDRFAHATGRSLPDDAGWGRGNRPVINVTWDDAQAYADWLSRLTGRRYRLPSEAEWEYAARAGGRGAYWWGFGLKPGQAVCLDCGSRWDNRATAPAGSFAPSPFGLYDTAGNVMEWVADCYRPGYRDAPADGQPRVSGDCSARVARGGAFNLPAASMRTYVRVRFAPETRFDILGFRLARDP